MDFSKDRIYDGLLKKHSTDPKQHFYKHIYTGLVYITILHVMCDY